VGNGSCNLKSERRNGLKKTKFLTYLLPQFVSRSSALTKVETMALKEWCDFLEDLEDQDKKIFWAESGFLPFTRACKTSDFLKLRPPKWFKLINRSSMSTLTQMCTNHAPTGEYFKRHVWKYQNTLGTGAQIPTGYMVKTLRLQSTCDSNMPSDQMLSTF